MKIIESFENGTLIDGGSGSGSASGSGGSTLPIIGVSDPKRFFVPEENQNGLNKNVLNQNNKSIYIFLALFGLIFLINK